jgi:hypothetical protein
MEVPSSVDHFAAKKQLSIFQYLIYRQFYISIEIGKLYQVVGLETGMIFVVWINVQLYHIKET